MGQSLSKYVICFIVIIILSLFFNVSVLALNETPGNDGIFFIALKTPYYSIGGDFDGEPDLFRVIGSACYGLYEFEDNLGEGIVFGATNELYSIEFSYSQSKHEINDKLGIIPRSFADLKSSNITVKFTSEIFAKKRIKPYGQIGYGLAQLKVENGAAKYLYSDFDTIYLSGFSDAKYTGSGWHLGFGILGRITNKLSIDASITYNRITFDEIKMFDYEYKPPQNDVLMTNTVGSVGIKYFFN